MKILYIKFERMHQSKKIWKSIDETNTTGWYIVNTIIGTLEIGNPGSFFIRFNSIRKI